MKIEEALKEYKYANIGQARAIAAELGYNEECNRGFLRFSTQDDEYKTSFDSIRSIVAGESVEERDILQDKSRDAVCQFFDKEKAENNFEQYKEDLRNSHNISIVKWDNLKADSNRKGISPDGFTIIDHDRKVCYTGQSLYEFAKEQQILLDGTGTKLEEGVMSDLTTVKGKPSKVRLQKGELRVYNRKESLVIPTKILGKKLTTEEKEILRRGEILPIRNKGSHLFCQVDRDLNSVIILTDKEIKVPDIIGSTNKYPGYKLTAADKYLLSNGKSIDNILMHSKEGYIIADISISPDKKGVRFTNVQNVTENKAKEIIQEMEKSKLENKANIETVAENDIRTEKAPEGKLTSITPDENTYLNALLFYNDIYPKTVPAFMKDGNITLEEMDMMKERLGIDDSAVPSIDFSTCTEEEFNAYDKALIPVSEQAIELLKLPIDYSLYCQADNLERNTVTPNESLFIHSVLSNDGQIGVFNSYVDGNILNLDSVKQIGINLGFESLFIEREHILFMNKLNYIDEDQMMSRLEQLDTKYVQLANKLKDLPIDFTGIDLKFDQNNIGKSAITPEERDFLHQILLRESSFPESLHISGKIDKKDYLDIIQSLGLLDNYNAYKEISNDPNYSGNQALQSKLDGVMDSTISRAKQLLTLPVKDLDLELRDAIQRNDFEKIAQLQEDGYKPSENTIRGLNKEGNLSDVQCVVVEKLFGVKPDLPEQQNLEMKEKSGELTHQEEAVFSKFDGSLDKEMIEAAIKEDFIKLDELKGQGYIPTPEIIKSLGESGLSQNTLVAVEKIFNLKGQNKTLGDVQLAHDTEHEKDLSRPIAQTVNQAFANL